MKFDNAVYGGYNGYGAYVEGPCALRRNETNKQRSSMYDTVRGPVTRVVDGDTFDIKVEFYGNHNKYQYDFEERIRIASIDAPELNTQAGRRSKEHLEQRLEGREVQCRVQARDEYRRLVAEVAVMN